MIIVYTINKIYGKEIAVIKRCAKETLKKYIRYTKHIEKNQCGDHAVLAEVKAHVVMEIPLFLLKISTYVAHILLVGMELQVRISALVNN